MEKQLGWTTIEQSKKLIEAGLDPKTADMFYSRRPTGESPYSKIPYIISENGLDVFTKADLPCWSLGRLIELMPKKINNENFTIELTNWSDWKYEVGYGLDVFQNNTLLDSILECLIWLLENNYIKKGETK